MIVGTVYEVVRRIRTRESLAVFRLGRVLSSEAKAGHSWALLVPGPLMSPTRQWGPREDRPSASVEGAAVAAPTGMLNLAYQNGDDLKE